MNNNPNQNGKPSSRRPWRMGKVRCVYGAEARKQLRERYAGVWVTEPGKPFRSGKYPGWFIPCTLRMGDGSRERIRLALRNDNSAGSWVVDGGL